MRTMTMDMNNSIEGLEKNGENLSIAQIEYIWENGKKNENQKIHSEVQIPNW